MTEEKRVSYTDPTRREFITMLAGAITSAFYQTQGIEPTAPLHAQHAVDKTALGERVRQCADKYVNEFMMPNQEYINGVGISFLSIMKERGFQFELNEGENITDLCISVYFEKTPPKDLNLPQEYETLRVFYEEMGPIVFA